VYHSLVLIEPTQWQPGQAQAAPDEHRTGRWGITKFSGAVGRERKTQLVERAEALLAALRRARGRATTRPPIRSGSAPRPSPSCSARLTAAGPPGGLSTRVASRPRAPGRALSRA